MFIRRFDHFTIRTQKLEATRDFYAQLLNLKEGPRPAFKFDGYWLYLDNQPIFHLAESATTGDDAVVQYLGKRDDKKGGSGALDHLAFRIEGYGSLLKKVYQYGWDYFERTVPDIHEHQLFLRDPNHITVELICHDDEYKQWQQEQQTSHI